MSETASLTVFCLASAEKGAAFLRELKRQGHYVILLTRHKHQDEPGWPREAIDQMELIDTLDDFASVIKMVNDIARVRRIDRVVALDDFDVETAALVREHLRLPGMSYSTARRFRDKLAMRVCARDAGIAVPEFVHTLNGPQIAEFAASVPPPWILKPRGEAAAVGIRKIESADELWPALEALGDKHPYFLLEQFVPGDIFHVDSIIWDREILFAMPSKYGRPPFDVAHKGGTFTTRTIPHDTGAAQTLLALNHEVVDALGLVRGVTHTEFIRSHEGGLFYFLETASRVGGANIADLVEAASGLNLWAEWACIELCAGHTPYQLPERRDTNAGLIISLAHQERPDTSAYADPEIVWRLEKAYHAGLIVASPDAARVEALLEEYSRRFYEDFSITMPAPETLR
jgi:carbamoylphosphate synthase large subunit